MKQNLMQWVMEKLITKVIYKEITNKRKENVHKRYKEILDLFKVPQDIGLLQKGGHRIEGYSYGYKKILVSKRVIELYDDCKKVFEFYIGHELAHYENNEEYPFMLKRPKHKDCRIFNGRQIIRELRCDLRSKDALKFDTKDIDEVFSKLIEIEEACNKEKKDISNQLGYLSYSGRRRICMNNYNLPNDKLDYDRLAKDVFTNGFCKRNGIDKSEKKKIQNDIAKYFKTGGK